MTKTHTRYRDPYVPLIRYEIHFHLHRALPLPFYRHG